MNASNLRIVINLRLLTMDTVVRLLNNCLNFFERKRRRKLRSNFRRNGVSLKFCECIYDRKWTQFCGKKITFALVVEIATTIGNMNKIECVQSSVCGRFERSSCVQLSWSRGHNVQVLTAWAGWGRAGLLWLNEAAPSLRSNIPQTALVETLDTSLKTISKTITILLRRLLRHGLGIYFGQFWHKL
jgi:hypothetical protein